MAWLASTEWLDFRELKTPVRLKARFLSLGATDILSWRILCGRGCPVHWSMFNGLPGLHPPDSSSSPSVVTIKSV